MSARTHAARALFAVATLTAVGCAVPEMTAREGLMVRRAGARESMMTVRQIVRDSVVVADARGNVTTIPITSDLELHVRRSRHEGILRDIGLASAVSVPSFAIAGAWSGSGNEAATGQAARAFENAAGAFGLSVLGGFIAGVFNSGWKWVPLQSRMPADTGSIGKSY